MKQQKTIKVCSNCDTPLIWTFCFPYNEYYCLNCGYKHGMMGAGKDIDLTVELKLKQNIVEAIWKQLYGKNWLLPTGNYGKTGCKKCSIETQHNNHLTKQESMKNKIAWEMVDKVKGIFNS